MRQDDKTKPACRHVPQAPPVPNMPTDTARATGRATEVESVRGWREQDQESSRRTAAGAEPRGIICRRQTQPGGVHLHRDIDLYYLRGQLHAVATEFRAADYRFRIPHLRDHRAVAHLRVPAGHGRDGAADRVSDPALLHPPDRHLLDGGVHGRLRAGMVGAKLRMGAGRARARSCRHRRDVAGAANHRVFHLPAVSPRVCHGHGGHGHERGASHRPHLGRLADRRQRLAFHLPDHDRDWRGLAGGGHVRTA